MVWVMLTEDIIPPVAAPAPAMAPSTAVQTGSNQEPMIVFVVVCLKVRSDR